MTPDSAKVVNILENTVVGEMTPTPSMTAAP
jgi:hypothetical protein